MNADAPGDVAAFVEKHIAQAAPVPFDDERGRRRRVHAERHDAKLLRKELTSAGLDVERVDTVAKDRGEARRARAAEERQRAIDASASVDRWLTELTPVVPLEPDSANIIVDRVTLIRTFAQAGVIVDSHIGSLDSWARYRLQPSSNAIDETGLGRLSFFTLWQNPRSTPIVASVGPRIVMNAHLSVDAERNGVADWFIGGSEARATVRARTTVMAMWDPSVQAIVSDVVLGSAGATGGLLGGDDSTSFAANQFLPGSGFFVPAQASILIELSLLTEYTLTSGSVDLDAAGGAFKVAVPHVIVTVT